MDAVGRKSVKFLLAMAFYYLGVNYVWISYNSIVLPTEMQAISVVRSGLLVGITAFTGVSLGVLINIFAGTLGDVHGLKVGKRWPYILIGALLALPGLLLPSSERVAFTVAFTAYVIMQAFTNFSSGSYQPLLKEIIEERQRGEASGFQGLMTLLGSAMGFGLTGYLVGDGIFRGSLLAMAAFFLGAALVTVAAVARYDRARGSAGRSGWGTMVDVFRPGRPPRGFFWLVLSAFLMFLGVTGLSYFELYYFQYILKVANPALFVGIAGVVFLMAAVVSSVGLGTLSDRIGRRNLILISGLIGGAGMALIPFMRYFWAFVVAAAFVAVAMGTLSSVYLAFASDLAPVESAGRYMAYANLAVGGSGAVAPLIDGLLLNSVGVTSPTAYFIMFLMSSTLLFLGSSTLMMVPKR